MGYADKAIVDFVLVDHPQTCPLEIFKHGLDIYKFCNTNSAQLPGDLSV